MAKLFKNDTNAVEPGGMLENTFNRSLLKLYDQQMWTDVVLLVKVRQMFVSELKNALNFKQYAEKKIIYGHHLMFSVDPSVVLSKIQIYRGIEYFINIFV